KLDLKMLLTEGKEGVRGILEYATDLYEAETVRRLIDQYVRVLGGMELETAMGEIEVEEEAERRRVVEDWNEEEEEEEGCRESVMEMVEEQAERRGDGVAVEDEEGQVTYGELNRRANQVGRYLRKLGVGVETRVGLLMERKVDLVVGMMGVLKAGGAYVPMEVDTPVER